MRILDQNIKLLLLYIFYPKGGLNVLNLYKYHHKWHKRTKHNRPTAITLSTEDKINQS